VPASDMNEKKLMYYLQMEDADEELFLITKTPKGLLQ
jgi:hypothetical protein